MIELNADESMMLLITKGWAHKEVPKQDNYIQLCMNKRCGCKANVYACYANLFEKLLTSRQVLRAYEETQRKTYPVNMLQALLDALGILPVVGHMTLDYSGMNQEGMEKFIN